MREYQITRNPNVMDLFVVAATCMAVLFLAFPIYADGQSCSKAERASAQPARVETSVEAANKEGSELPVTKLECKPVIKREKRETPVKAVASESRPLQEKGSKQSEAAKADADDAHAVQQISVDIEGLKTRLQETDAIGVFTKLAIRSDILDLVAEINRHRKKNRLEQKITEMRASFDGLLLKMVALLERDPDLSRDLYVSRESIWKSLLEVKV